MHKVSTRIMLALMGRTWGARSHGSDPIIDPKVLRKLVEFYTVLLFVMWRPQFLILTSKF